MRNISLVSRVGQAIYNMTIEEYTNYMHTMCQFEHVCRSFNLPVSNPITKKCDYNDE